MLVRVWAESIELDLLPLELFGTPFASVTGVQYRPKESTGPSWWIRHGMMFGVHFGVESLFANCELAFEQG